MVKLLKVRDIFFSFSLLLCKYALAKLLIYSARVIIDRESGRSRGFGFVTFTSSEEASAAITGMDGKVLVSILSSISWSWD